MSCKECHSSKNCQRCDGKGSTGGGMTNPKKCGYCNGRGVCPRCKGNG